MFKDGGWDWLGSGDGKDWLSSKDDGWEWLNSGNGKDWLRSKDDGWEWLRSDIGWDWLGTADGKAWLRAKADGFKWMGIGDGWWYWLRFGDSGLECLKAKAGWVGWVRFTDRWERPYVDSKEQREWQQDHDQKQKYTEQEDTVEPPERPPTEEEITQALETLEIRKTKEVVTSNEVSKAYRTKALLDHPDRNNGNPEAVEKMKETNAANEILSRYIRLRDE